MDEPACSRSARALAKVDLLDQESLASLGITIAPDRLLLDALLFDRPLGRRGPRASDSSER